MAPTATSALSAARFPWLASLAALSLGALVAIGGGEILLRLVGYDGQHARVHSVFDPRFGTVRRDSWVFDMSMSPPTANLRGQRVPFDKPPGETRVLFVGDSGTEGAMVPRQSAFPARFEAVMRVRMPERRVRAINAGVFGMTTLDELHFLPRLLPLKPDVVVLAIFLSNDINFNLGHVERRKPDSAGLWPRLVDESALAHFVHLRLLSWGGRIGEGLPNASAWLPMEAQLIDDYGFHMLSYPAGEVALYMSRPSALVDRAYAVLEQALRHFIALGQTHEFKFAVLLIPAPSAVAGSLRLLHYPDIYGELARQGVEVSAPQLDVHLPRQRVMALCERLSLLCVDPTRRLQEIGMGVFFPTDEHPTATGHAALAQALAERAQDLLD